MFIYNRNNTSKNKFVININNEVSPHYILIDRGLLKIICFMYDKAPLHKLFNLLNIDKSITMVICALNVMNK